jgi:hypothetical protein
MTGGCRRCDMTGDRNFTRVGSMNDSGMKEV